MPESHPIWFVPKEERKNVVCKALDWYFSDRIILEEIRKEVQELKEELRRKPTQAVVTGEHELKPVSTTRRRLPKEKWLDF